MKRRKLLIILMLILSLGMIACGSSKEDSKGSKESKKETTSESDEKKDKKQKEETEEIVEEPAEEVVEEKTEEVEEVAEPEPAQDIICEGTDNLYIQFFEIPQGTTIIAKDAFVNC